MKQNGLIDWTPAQTEAFYVKRRSRNIALGLVLGAFALLILGITIVRMV